MPQVDVLAKGLKREQVAVTIEEQRLRVVTTDAEGALYGAGGDAYRARGQRTCSSQLDWPKS
jgi:hypothetical protein